MRRVLAGVVVVLLLAGCGSPADPGDGESTPPSAAPTGGPDLGAVCDALDDTLKLPGDGTVQYIAKFNKPTGWATNAPICDIEPDGTYHDVAAKVPAFGRAEFNYGILTEAQLQQTRYPEYNPETAQKLLTLDEAQPLSDQVPCASEPCKDGVHGYLYSFRFETKRGDIAVIARLDYITTDVSGEKQPQYRLQAIQAFTASMDVIAAKLK
jgi:hypothetical protein